jgi:transcriptional regulator with PAS, ATPase and Fis domain
MKERALQDEVAALRAELYGRRSFQNVLSKSPKMIEVFDLIGNIAQTTSTVLIIGETGTGKEQVARAIHQSSAELRSGQMVAVNCAAIPETLLESELFGHEKGSFTGAISQRKGRFEQANKGTLFLDEVGDIPLNMQVKLLRVIQERRIERVGGSEPIHIDVRLIAATHQSLEKMVKDGKFREDLYYRLNVVSLEMPSLRERRSDIPELVKFFLDRYAKDNGKAIEGCAPAALELLMNHSWPGNVRELENAIERAVVLSSGSLIETKQLPAAIKPMAAPTGMPVIPGATMAEVERYTILETLKSTGGSTSRAAEILGISPRTIQYRLHDYNAAPKSEVAVVLMPDRNATNKS